MAFTVCVTNNTCSDHHSTGTCFQRSANSLCYCRSTSTRSGTCRYLQQPQLQQTDQPPSVCLPAATGVTVDDAVPTGASIMALSVLGYAFVSACQPMPRVCFHRKLVSNDESQLQASAESWVPVVS